MMSNYLLDQDFLRTIDLAKNKNTYAKIILLTNEENPVYEIQGKITQGSINIDGASAVRRTCSLTMVAQDVDVFNTYWALKNKFKLEVGVENSVNLNYPEIIWFKQGTYVFTSLNMSVQSNGFNININGKDKMCLLNGEVGGNINASTDFGQLEEYVNVYDKVSYEFVSENWEKGKYYIDNRYDTTLQLDYSEIPVRTREFYRYINEGIKITEFTYTKDPDVNNNGEYIEISNYNDEEYIKDNWSKLYTVSFNEYYLISSVYDYEDVHDSLGSDIKLYYLNENHYQAKDETGLIKYFTYDSQQKEYFRVQSSDVFDSNIDYYFQEIKFENGEPINYLNADYYIKTEDGDFFVIVEKGTRYDASKIYYEYISENNQYYTATLVRQLTPIPIVDIIKNAVHVYGGEPKHNIILNDIDNYGLELLEYRGDRPMYMLRNINTGEVDNVTMNGGQQYLEKDSNDNITLDAIDHYYDRTNTENSNKNATIIYTPKQDVTGVPLDDIYYNVIKIMPYETVGYRTTELTYPGGELMANVGESLVSVLDKIKNVFGDFEYFYDVDGRFIFQKKKTYVSTSWNPIQDIEEQTYVVDAAYTSSTSYSFEEGQLLSAFTNAPQILNIRNDFSVWGKRTSASGTELPVHMRYAIDDKPTHYQSWDGTHYYANRQNTTDIANEYYDWRELIYQMALDYFKYGTNLNFSEKLQENNPDFINGKTGYEIYYTDMQGFWRQIYNPKATTMFGVFVPVSKITPQEFEDDVWYNQNGEIVSTLPQAEYYQSISLIDATQEELSGLLAEANLYYYDIKYDENGNYLDDGYYQEKEIQDDRLKEYVTFEKVSIEDVTDTNYRNYYEKDNNRFISIQNFYLYKKEGYVELNITQDISTGEFSVITGFNRHVTEAPELLNFWFDFMNTNGELGQYSVHAIGNRPKAINNDKVKAIYFKEVPQVIFLGEHDVIPMDMTGYTFIRLTSQMENYFTISAQGLSAKDEIDNLLYQHTYAADSVTLTSLPIYHLQPNTRILVKDNYTGINGEYIVSKITIPLQYNGTSSISASRAVERIY